VYGNVTAHVNEHLMIRSAHPSAAVLLLCACSFLRCQTPTKAEADTALGTQRPDKPKPPPPRRPPAVLRAEPMPRAEEIVRNRLSETVVAMTRELVRHPTFVDEQDRSAEPRARETFMRALQTQAESLGLSFTRVTPLSAEINLPADVDGATRVMGFLAHGDVVPPGPGWTHPAFAGELSQGRIWGRGALDDKGPIAAVLVAMAAARDAGVPRPFITRLIVGMAEETSWECMQGYLKQRPAPDFTMVVDGNFPVTVGEKGVAGVKIAERFNLLAPSPGRCVLSDLQGGSSSNVVPATAEAILQCNGVVDKVAQALADAGLSARVQVDRITVRATGRAAPATTPDQGINALMLLLHALDERAMLDDAQGGVLLVRFLARRAADLTGESLGILHTAPRFTSTTVNVGKLKIDGNTLVASLNIRMPPPATAASVVTTVQAAADTYTSAAGVRSLLVVEGGGMDGVDVDPERAEVRALMTAYRTVLKKEPRAVILTGTTYARSLPNAVGFGPEEDGAPERRHGADESIGVDELVDLAAVYAAAITSLAQASVTP